MSLNTRALIVLPERGHDEPVDPFHMSSVLAILKAHDLLVQETPLAT
jgi:hypothetical protein